MSFCYLCPGRIQESPGLVEDIIMPPLNIFNVYCLHLVTLDKTFCKVDYLPTRTHRNYSLHGANFTVFIVSHFSCDWNSIPSRSSQGKILFIRNLNIYNSLNLSAVISMSSNHNWQVSLIKPINSLPNYSEYVARRQNRKSRKSTYECMARYSPFTQGGQESISKTTCRELWDYFDYFRYIYESIFSKMTERRLFLFQSEWWCSPHHIFTHYFHLSHLATARSWYNQMGLETFYMKKEEKISKWDNLAIFSMKTHSYFHVTPSLSRTTF